MLSDADVEQAITTLRWQDILFQDRAHRDQVWAALRKHEDAVINGQEVSLGDTRLRRNSIRGQLLDPRYTFEGRNIEDKGLANDYRHYHAVLYSIEPRR
jgi:hypothetical protein